MLETNAIQLKGPSLAYKRLKTAKPNETSSAARFILTPRKLGNGAASTSRAIVLNCLSKSRSQAHMIRQPTQTPKEAVAMRIGNKRLVEGARSLLKT